MSVLKGVDMLEVRTWHHYYWLLLRAGWTKAWSLFGALTTGAAFIAWIAARRFPNWADTLTDLAWQIPAVLSGATLLLRWLLAPFEVHKKARKQAEKAIAALGDELVELKGKPTPRGVFPSFPFGGEGNSYWGIEEDAEEMVWRNAGDHDDPIDVELDWPNIPHDVDVFAAIRSEVRDRASIGSSGRAVEGEGFGLFRVVSDGKEIITSEKLPRSDTPHKLQLPIPRAHKPKSYRVQMRALGNSTYVSVTGAFVLKWRP